MTDTENANAAKARAEADPLIPYELGFAPLRRGFLPGSALRRVLAFGDPVQHVRHIAGVIDV
jgi:hypothetical protein